MSALAEKLFEVRQDDLRTYLTCRCGRRFNCIGTRDVHIHVVMRMWEAHACQKQGEQDARTEG